MARTTSRTTEEQRKAAGQFLRERRQEIGVTQREIALALGLDYVTMVSQIEVGKARVPPARYADYARVLKMTPEDFCKKLLRFYDYNMWCILFGPSSASSARGGDGGTNDPIETQGTPPPGGQPVRRAVRR